MKLPLFTLGRVSRGYGESGVDSTNISTQRGLVPSGDCGCGGDDKCIGQCVHLPLAPGPSCIGQCVALPRHWF
jgi:hypothetical protein